MSKREIRDFLCLIGAILCIWLYLPHIFVLFLNKKVYSLVYSDLIRRKDKLSLKLSISLRNKRGDVILEAALLNQL